MNSQLICNHASEIGMNQSPIDAMRAVTKVVMWFDPMIDIMVPSILPTIARPPSSI